MSVAVNWVFNLPGHGLQVWDWSGGAPPALQLVSVRAPASGDVSRHIPVRVFSTTTRSTVRVESGLERDLV